jgi:methionyl-tRNA formyltransferase
MFVNVPYAFELPIRYRGAAPVQRAIQDGVTETGVSVAYTVLKCDAGPVLVQERVSAMDVESLCVLRRIMVLKKYHNSLGT